MKNLRLPLLCLLAVTALTLAGGQVYADLYGKSEVKGDTIPLPKPTEVKSLSVFPTSVSLRGTDDSAQLIVTGQLAARQQDLTGAIEFTVANDKLARVTSLGRIIPIANGKTEVIAKFGNHTVKIPLTNESMDVNLPINFPNDIVPIFTKLGCNSGGCHGKSGGQNGFALSLLGFVPEMDYRSLVKETRGRRVFPASPENSLLLLKAAGVMAHAGGKRMEVGSDEYKLIRRWVASGMPYGKPDDPVVTKITIHPERSVVTRQNRQQFSVLAHYSDGNVQDVTQRAQYESNDQEIAVVDGAALVRSLDMSGEAAIMARYQGQVGVFRASVPLGEKIPNYMWKHNTVVDVHTHNKWKELGLVPSDICSDREYIRRVYLDLTGSLPTPEVVNQFVASKDMAKRAKLVDDLLETPEYAYFFAAKWADILRVRRGNQNSGALGTFAMHGWLRDAISKDMPYDRFIRSILAANGDETSSPPTVWYKNLRNAQEFNDDTAQVFLGLRIACAQCHHHPYEKWSQDDYWNMAAFFGRIGRKNVDLVGGVGNQRLQMTRIYTTTSNNVRNKRNNQPAKYVPLDSGETLTIGPESDPRHNLVDWMVKPDNPYVPKAIANRYWAHFFGRGIVDPLDDMRVTNPPSNPELLDALSQDLVKNKFSLKQLIRTICNSRTYQLSSVPNKFNKHDKQTYARYYPRRMSAEVLFDAVNLVTKTPPSFSGLPNDTHSPKRAIMLPDESFRSYFLDVFGRPQRISACECERVSEANLAQALHMLNSNEVQGKIARGGGRADLLARDKDRSDAEKVKEMFMWCFSRQPSQEHLDIALRHIERHASNKKIAYEDILWALVNTKEFVFNR